jgi:NodT family efflux transporter outer membrane factor (OMF) lipoprotein
MDSKPTSSRGTHRARIAIGSACLVLAAGCAVGPDYKRPEVATPAAFKEGADWGAAVPSDDTRRGPWWEVFNDPVLSGLESQVDSANLTIAQAAANYDEARQIARADRTAYLPTIGVSGSATRERVPAAETETVQGFPATGHSLQETSYAAELTGSWAPDFWGKVRRTVESDVATAQANAADLASARLSTEATLATDYIELRSSDDQMRLLENAVAAYRRTVSITKNKYAVGVSARSDIITAQTELDSTRAQLIGVGVQRAQYEHAIAILLGKAPADFSISRRAELGITMPKIPPVVPAKLLERRPDISAAERAAASANAKIGIQTAAYFPAVTLTGAGGYEGSPLSQLISRPFEFWTLGASAADTLLDWGQRHDLVLSAKATYLATAENYKLTVLTAFQQVEDNLAEIRILGQEALVESDAVTEAAQASQIAVNEYNAGTVDFTTVVAAQVTELTNRETALGIIQNQLTSSVALIQALGGGWTTDDLPKPGKVVSH